MTQLLTERYLFLIIKNRFKVVRIQVFMAATIKMRAFCDIALCSLGVDRHFKGAYCLNHHPDGGDNTYL
jgi:hypothetical protein